MINERGFGEWPGYEGEVLTSSEWMAVVEAKFIEQEIPRRMRWDRSERLRQDLRIRQAIARGYHAHGFVGVTV